MDVQLSPVDRIAVTGIEMGFELCRACLDQGSVVVFDEKHNPERSGYQMLPALDMSNIMVRFLTLPVFRLGLSLRAGLLHSVTYCNVCTGLLSSFLQISLGQLMHFRKSSTSDAPIDHELLHCSTTFQAVRAMGMRWGLKCREFLSQAL